MMMYVAMIWCIVRTFVYAWSFFINRDGLFIFFFKQKTAYEITVWLEFRRVLFRSRSVVLPHEEGEVGVQRLEVGVVRFDEAAQVLARQIGRASCRERGVDLGGRRIIKKKKEKNKLFQCIAYIHSTLIIQSNNTRHTQVSRRQRSYLTLT